MESLGLWSRRHRLWLHSLELWTYLCQYHHILPKPDVLCVLSQVAKHSFGFEIVTPGSNFSLTNNEPCTGAFGSTSNHEKGHQPHQFNTYSSAAQSHSRPRHDLMLDLTRDCGQWHYATDALRKPRAHQLPHNIPPALRHVTLSLTTFRCCLGTLYKINVLIPISRNCENMYAQRSVLRIWADQKPRNTCRLAAALNAHHPLRTTQQPRPSRTRDLGVQTSTTFAAF